MSLARDPHVLAKLRHWCREIGADDPGCYIGTGQLAILERERKGLPAGQEIAAAIRTARCRMLDRRRSEAADQKRTQVWVSTRPRREDQRLDMLLDVAEMLSVLPAEQSAALVGCYGLGLSYAELGARYGWSIGMVRTRLDNGLIALRQRFRGYLD